MDAREDTETVRFLVDLEATGAAEARLRVGEVGLATASEGGEPRRCTGGGVGEAVEMGPKALRLMVPASCGFSARMPARMASMSVATFGDSGVDVL